MKKSSRISLLFFFFIMISMLHAENHRQKNIDNKSLNNLNGNVSKVINLLNKKIPKILKKHSIPGASAVIANKEKTLWINSYGYTDINNEKTVDAQTLFSLQSSSKMFTALGALFAAQNQIIDLNYSVKHYLPNFNVQSVYSSNPTSKMTIIDLLSHRAGLAHEAPIGNNYYPYSPSFKAHIESIQNTWLRFPVGQRYCYSNLGIDLVGYILQEITSIQFPELMKKTVLDPIDMTSSTFDIKKVLKSNNYAKGIVNNKTAPLNIAMIPCGGLYSNTEDMGKYLSFQLNNGAVNKKQLLEQKYINLMRTIPNKLNGQTIGYGLGLAVYNFKNFTIYSHDGGGYGFNTIVFWIPTLNFGVSILFNGYVGEFENFFWEILSLLSPEHQNLEKQLGTINLKPLPKKNQNIDKEFKDWTGTYVETRSLAPIKVSIKDKIFGFIENNDFEPLIYVGDNKFYNEKTKKLYQLIKGGEYYSKYILDVGTGSSWNFDYNSKSSKGSNIEEWSKYCGVYEYDLHPKVFIDIKIINGYLTAIVNNSLSLRLQEFKDGLFRIPNGEVLNLSKKPYSLNNIKIKNFSKIPISKIFNDCINKLNKENKFFDKDGKLSNKFLLGELQMVIKKYYYLKEHEPEKYDFSEYVLEELGKNLNWKQGVIEILKLNVNEYPNSPKAYETLADAYKANNETQLAKENYEKALNIDLSNIEIKTKLEELKNK